MPANERIEAGRGRPHCRLSSIACAMVLGVALSLAAAEAGADEEDAIEGGDEDYMRDLWWRSSGLMSWFEVGSTAEAKWRMTIVTRYSFVTRARLLALYLHQPEGREVIEPLLKRLTPARYRDMKARFEAEREAARTDRPGALGIWGYGREWRESVADIALMLLDVMAVRLCLPAGDCPPGLLESVTNEWKELPDAPREAAVSGERFVLGLEERKHAGRLRGLGLGIGIPGAAIGTIAALVSTYWVYSCATTPDAACTATGPAVTGTVAAINIGVFVAGVYFLVKAGPYARRGWAAVLSPVVIDPAAAGARPGGPPEVR